MVAKVRTILIDELKEEIKTASLLSRDLEILLDSAKTRDNKKTRGPSDHNKLVGSMMKDLKERYPSVKQTDIFSAGQIAGSLMKRNLISKELAMERCVVELNNRKGFIVFPVETEDNSNTESVNDIIHDIINSVVQDEQDVIDDDSVYDAVTVDDENEVLDDVETENLLKRDFDVAFPLAVENENLGSTSKQPRIEVQRKSTPLPKVTPAEHKRRIRNALEYLADKHREVESRIRFGAAQTICSVMRREGLSLEDAVPIALKLVNDKHNDTVFKL